MAESSAGAPVIQATGVRRILIVCTGNICRSPFGEIVLRERLAGTGIDVSSAGIGALEGHPVEPAMVVELEKRGMRADGFRAHQIDAFDVQDADLILVMSRRQRRFITEEWPRAAKKTVLMGAAPAIADELVGPDPSGAVQAVARRSNADVVEVEDPYRKDPGVFSRVADEIDAAATALADALIRAGRRA